MKILARLCYILVGGMTGAMLTYALAWCIGAIFGPLYQSEADMSRNFTIFLTVSIIMIIAGFVAGNFAFNRYTSGKNDTRH